MQTTAAIIAQHRRGLKRVVELGQQKHTALWSQFIGAESTEFERETLSTIDEFGYASTIAEGTAIDLNQLSAPYSMNVTPTMKALGFSISKLAKETDAYGKIAKAGKYLMQSMMATREYNAANVLSLGFTAPSSGGTATMDSLALFSASHTLASGTDSNLQTSSALAIATLESGVQMAGTVSSHKGKPSMYDGRFHLIVPDSLEMTAKRIAEADKYPQTNYNDPNVVKPRVTVLVNPYLSSTTSWFLAPADTSRSPLIRMTQLALEYDVTYENNPPSFEHIVFESDAWFAQDWRHTQGNTA